MAQPPEELIRIVQFDPKAKDAKTETFDLRDLDYFPPGESAWSNGHEREQPKSKRALIGINPADWEGVEVPSRKWIVPDYIPDETVTLLYADGGTGKSYLDLQLAVARAVAKEWIGLLPEPGRTLVLSAEDDANEMHRRLEGIRKFYRAAWSDLKDIRLVDLVGEDCVLGELNKGRIHPTEMYHALDAYMTEFRPSLTCLDVLADMYGGDEINRVQVRQFVGLLKKLSLKHHCAILLLAHPSLTGMNTGTGTSGSTGWSNAVRSRLYFQTVKGEEGDEPNKDLRTFEGMKANYGERGGKFDLVWKDGLFRRVIEPTGFDKLATERQAEDVFMTMLKRFTEQHRPARVTEGKSYAPSLFAVEPGSQGIKSKDFAQAMLRLFDQGKISNELETEGAPSRRLHRLVIS